MVTLAELHVGVLLARDPVARSQRLRTLTTAENTFDAIPVDAAVARRFAELRAELRRLRRNPGVLDTLIAATAISHDMTVVTHDADFERMPFVQVLRV